MEYKTAGNVVDINIMQFLILIELRGGGLCLRRPSTTILGVMNFLSPPGVYW